jgi:hypothetical protein
MAFIELFELQALIRVVHFLAFFSLGLFLGRDYYYAFQNKCIFTPENINKEDTSLTSDRRGRNCILQGLSALKGCFHESFLLQSQAQNIPGR